MFEQTFKNIDDVLWKEAGCSSELDYTEQTSWLLFLRYLDDLEQERAMAAELVGKPYDYFLDKAHRWSSWAVPKTADGTVDHDTAVTGDDLIAFVNTDLFPYLKGFTDRSSSPDTIEYKIGAIFAEIENKFRSGYSLRDAPALGMAAGVLPTLAGHGRGAAGASSPAPTQPVPRADSRQERRCGRQR
jgi:type I restriction enzyme M protein